MEKKKISPVYLFRGQERYIMEEFTSRLVEKITGGESDSFNLDIEYGGEVDIERFISTANSFPFLGERRVLILKELHKLKGKWKEIISYANNPVPSSVMVFLCDSHDESGRRLRHPKDYSYLEAAIKKNGEIIQFDFLYVNDLREYVKRRAERSGLEMDSKTAGALIGSVGEDLYNIQNELDKLSLVYEKGKISEHELASVVGRYRLNAIDELLDCAGLSQGNRPIEILSSILNSGVERPSVVIYLLIRHFLTLLKIKAGHSGKGGYYYKRLGDKADKLGTRKILVWLENLRLAEVMMKSISYPEEILLESVFIHSIRGIRIDGIEDPPYRM